MHNSDDVGVAAVVRVGAGVDGVGGAVMGGAQREVDLRPGDKRWSQGERLGVGPNERSTLGVGEN